MSAEEFYNKDKNITIQFTKLTRTGISTNYDTIFRFAEDYAKQREQAYLKQKVLEITDEDKNWILADEYAKDCSLSNFFDEDDIQIIKQHYVNGIEKCKQLIK